MTQIQKNDISRLLHQLSGLKISEFIKLLTEEFPGQVTFSSSFSYEDQVITHEILNNQLPVKIFTLDTGRMFAETYSVWSSTNAKYGTNIKAYYPNAEALQEFIEAKGPNSFYESVENRKSCCGIRKVEPLKRALAGNAIWITGLRAEHSADRHDLPMLEWDESNKIIKYHPILHWTTEEVKKYINDNSVPYNPLHDKGFVSIGCAPCTRAIKPGEDFRAGRWWWEDADKKECGLHVHEG
ncbi:phosphoadenylyl-sulfate reductase [Ferruginibacter lapsinanis]|uniref:phosphoadenylyl-sulfate reductase n=1 Tax=Ferruginibacter lapsinanis TaxID=563172 RepID=UPI001E2A45A3|nr:phosphoadenylyl-sulfate reductase [Ferruginibacter lapsinanis]UEG48988.1 phosphoadenylyl-sulfate reductase [Ferruginibacter lapsinanis]